MSSDNVRYDNYTMYGIHDSLSRDLLAGYNYFLVMSSIIGDTLILVGSCRYSAIKLHKILVVLIQHLAVADLLLSIVRILPGAVSLTLNFGVFGHMGCYPAYFLSLIAYGTVVTLPCALAAAKCVLVKFPLRGIHFSSKAAHVTACIIWAWFILTSTVTLINNRGEIYFSFLTYNCQCSYSFDAWGSIWSTAKFVTSGLFLLALILTMLLSSAILIVEARRATERGHGALRWQGLMTVLLTVLINFTINIPGVVYFVGGQVVEEIPPGPFHTVFFGIVVYLGYFNSVTNFYIYTLTLHSFRQFLKSKIFRVSVE